jgi:hypothetical protein
VEVTGECFVVRRRDVEGARAHVHVLLDIQLDGVTNVEDAIDVVPVGLEVGLVEVEVPAAAYSDRSNENRKQLSFRSKK